MDGEHELQELLNQATYVWNQRENARGYSPYQHALGRMPDTDGRLFEARTHDMPLGLMFDPEGEIEVAQQLRNQAEKVFIDWQLQEKLQKPFLPGDLVFYWPMQISGADKPSWNRGGYVGPPRVLAIETKLDEDQRLHPSSVMWLVRGTKLVKVAAEQVRHASARETCLHELERPPRLPWTFSGIVRDLKKGEFFDHTVKGPPLSKRSSVEPCEQEHPTAKRRYSSKMPSTSEENKNNPRHHRSRSPPNPDKLLFTGPAWQDTRVKFLELSRVSLLEP
jgi:hypothetical protein